MTLRFDALICGGGLSGLLMARQLRREIPSLSVAVVEKQARPLPEAGHKVGESSVELGSHYLERLGLREYLIERQFFKFGLRFFPGGGHLPPEQRVEVGPSQNPVVPSYQLDRGRLESDLREMIEKDGVTLIEGASVRDVELGTGGAEHTVQIKRGTESQTAHCKWIIDASGRNALLRNKLKMKRGGGHAANAGWYRVKGRIDITDMVKDKSHRWHKVPGAEQRWLSTNHFMGIGYWVWVIPLASGTTSIGAVVHDEIHPFDTVRTLERCQGFIQKYEPHLWEFIKDAEIIDFRCLSDYCHQVSRCWHPDRWALIGEAGAFTDPMYSPGTDYIALANSFTIEMIKTELEGGDVERRSRELNVQYRALVTGSIGVYKDAAYVYGHAKAMMTKVYWDNLVYWSYPAQYFFQNIFKISGPEHDPFAMTGARFVELSMRMQTILREYAKLTKDDPVDTEGKMVPLPVFPSKLIDAHLALQRPMGHAETLAYMKAQLVDTEFTFSEIVLRLLQELGPERSEIMWNTLNMSQWEIEITPDRAEAEEHGGRPRRQALPTMARDIERLLGAVQGVWDARSAIAFIREKKQVVEMA